MKVLALILSGIPAITGSAMSQSNPDGPGEDRPIVILNARIWTGDAAKPWAEAMVTAGDTIRYVGTNEGAAAAAEEAKGAGTAEGAGTVETSEATVIDAAGRFVVPGFIDSHIHFFTGGSNLSSVQLRDAATPAEFISRIKAFAETIPAGTWITGGDWDHTNWDGTLPERSWIDSVTTEHPVWVNRLDGHMALANSAALSLASVGPNHPDVEGGTVVRDASGHPTGLLKDNAMDAVWQAVPTATPEIRLKALEAASSYVAEQGVTSVHDVDGWWSLDQYAVMRNKGTLKTRIYACAPLGRAKALSEYTETNGTGDTWIRTGCVKGFMDGSLGSHTAAFFEPFEDSQDDRGFLVDSEVNLARMMREADSYGHQLAIHAIGDRAISILLGIFEEVEAANGMRDRRFRVEHSQHLAPTDFGRFRELDVIASMQPYHAIDDGRWADKVIGSERAKTTYAFRSFLDADVRLAFGSDWFVAPPTPLEGIYAAVTRRTLDDRNPDGWVPEQKITVEEALRAYTLDAAYASFEENIKGSLEVGKLADFAIIDRDLTAIPPAEIKEARVDLTAVGGRVVYERR